MREASGVVRRLMRVCTPVGARRMAAATMAVVAAVSLASPAPALAVPGLTLERYAAWATASFGPQASVVRGVQPNTGGTEFIVTSRVPGFAILVRGESSDEHRVDEETLSVRPEAAPASAKDLEISHSGAGPGFAEFARTYGAAIAADYRHARLEASVVNRGYDTTSTLGFFRGTRYGYIVTSGASNDFSLIALPGLKPAIEVARACARGDHKKCPGD